MSRMDTKLEFDLLLTGQGGSKLTRKRNDDWQSSLESSLSERNVMWTRWDKRNGRGRRKMGEIRSEHSNFRGSRKNDQNHRSQTCHSSSSLGLAKSQASFARFAFGLWCFLFSFKFHYQSSSFRDSAQSKLEWESEREFETKVWRNFFNE